MSAKVMTFNPNRSISERSRSGSIPITISKTAFDAQILRTYKEDVWQTSLIRFPMNLLGHLLQRTRVRIYADVEFLRVLASALINKEPVSGPDVDHYPLAGMGR